MTATTQEVMRAEREGKQMTLPLASTAATYKRGHFLNIPSNGYGKAGADTSGDRFAGIAAEEVTVASGGSNGDSKIKVIQKGVHLCTFYSTLTQADMEKAAYIKDNNLLARVGDVSNAVFAGVIKEVKSSSQAWVDIGPAIPGLATLANAIS